MSETPISAVVITYNEEHNIERCLKSLDGAVDEIIVVDSFSTDRTEEICRLYNVRFEQHVFKGHIEQTNYAMDQATNDWVLSLDADEALSKDLKETIINLKVGGQEVAYRFNRMTNYCGKWIRHSGWYPDAKIRLWNRKSGKWGGQNPHDRVVLEENVTVKALKGDLHHYSIYSMAEHMDQVQKFSSISAQSAFDAGKKSSLMVNLIIGPAFTFFNKYFLKGGFRDGYFGFVICMFTAFSRFLKYSKLRELERKSLE